MHFKDAQRTMNLWNMANFLFLEALGKEERWRYIEGGGRLALRELQIRTLLSHHHTPPKWLKLKDWQYQVGRNVGRQVLKYTAGGSVPLWKMFSII